MEDIAWKRDETPYLVFRCEKCNQYTYVKTTRKTKKCARCRYLNTIENVNGVVVKGISIAVELVKQRQHELAIKELGTSPEFRASEDFKIATNIKNEFAKVEEIIDEDFTDKFYRLLLELYEMYRKFPFYMIELNAEKYGIPSSEVKLLARSFQKKGILLKSSKDMYTFMTSKNLSL